MNRILLTAGLFLTVVTVVCLSAPVDSRAGRGAIFLGAEGVSKGVSCEINEVTLFAQSAEDCEKAGGTIGDAMPSEVKDMGDNPEEEPEIQRTKDKEPEAP